MKPLLMVFLLVLSACTSFQNFQEQPVVELGNKTYKTTCNGMAEGWDSCFRKAKRTCLSSYDLIEKIELNNFTHREMTFKCHE